MAIFNKENFNRLYIDIYEKKNIIKSNLGKVTDAFGLVDDDRNDIESLIK